MILVGLPARGCRDAKSLSGPLCHRHPGALGGNCDRPARGDRAPSGAFHARNAPALTRPVPVFKLEKCRLDGCNLQSSSGAVMAAPTSTAFSSGSRAISRRNSGSAPGNSRPTTSRTLHADSRRPRIVLAMTRSLIRPTIERASAARLQTGSIRARRSAVLASVQSRIVVWRIMSGAWGTAGLRRSSCALYSTVRRGNCQDS